MTTSTETRLNAVWSMSISALAGLMFIATCVYLTEPVKSLATPFATSRSEAFVLDGALRLAHGVRLYQPIAESPTTIHVYNFFSYAIPAFAAIPFEATPENILLAGRLVSFGTSLALCVLLGFWAYRSFTSVPAAIFAALLPFYFHDIALTQFFRLRPESAATFFSVAAIIVLLKPTLAIKPIALAAVLCGSAFLFKQSFIVAPVAIVVYLIIRSAWRELAYFVTVGGGVIVATTTALYLGYGSAYFENIIVAMAGNEIRPWTALAVYAKYFIGNLYGLVLALPAALIIAWRLRANCMLLFCYWIVALVWNVYSSGKSGSGASYYAEFAAASILLIISALFTADGQDDRILRRLPAVFVLAPLLVQVLTGAFQGFANHKPVIASDDAGVDLTPYFARYRSNQRKLIFHERIAIQLGNPVGYDWFLTDILIWQRHYDPDTLIRRIRSGEFSAVVFSQHPYSKLENYAYHAVKNGPFRRVYEDQTIVEWRWAPE